MWDGFFRFLCETAAWDLSFCSCSLHQMLCSEPQWSGSSSHQPSLQNRRQTFNYLNVEGKFLSFPHQIIVHQTFSHEGRNLEIHHWECRIVGHLILFHVIKLYSALHFFLLLSWRSQTQKGAEFIDFPSGILKEHDQIPFSALCPSRWEPYNFSRGRITQNDLLPRPYLHRTCRGVLSKSLSSSTSRSHGRTMSQTPLRPQKDTRTVGLQCFKGKQYKCMATKITSHTFSLHESWKVVVPVSRMWLDPIHAIKVEIRHHVVLCIAGNVDNLQEKRHTLLKLDHLSGSSLSYVILRLVSCPWLHQCQFHPCFSVVCLIIHWENTKQDLCTRQFCSQKDFGTNWTGKCVLMSRGEVGSLSARSFPVWRYEKHS